jgi:PadR family transcriptional regulator, regulatory protein PadR
MHLMPYKLLSEFIHKEDTNQHKTHKQTKHYLLSEDANMFQDYRNQIIHRITKNLLDIQLLRLIESEPIWGYKIKKTFEADSGITLRHGALYPTLNCLEQEGFLASQKQQHNGRVRKVYTVTEKGKMYLESYFAVLKEQMKDKRPE